MDSTSRIRPLPADAIAQIKSSITVTSLNAVVVELLKNSLDANSRKIEIVLDYSRGNCVIEDDGVGILPIEFTESGGLGKLHYSSKYNGTIATNGNRGVFLASVASLSLVLITSHHHMHHSHNTLIINRSQVIDRQTPAPPYQHIHTHNHGTRITVRDLFGTMPVRVKQRVEESRRLPATGRDWEDLRKLITSLVLARPTTVALVVRNSISDQKLQFRGTKSLGTSGNNQTDAKLVAHVCNTLSQAMFISSPDQSRWISTRASTPRICIKGAISLEPAPTKAAQFLALGMEPIKVQYGHSLMYDEINRLFEHSSFGNEDGSSDIDGVKAKKMNVDGISKGASFTNKQLRGSRKRLDRWPMFFIQIEFLDLVSQRVVYANTNDLMEEKSSDLSSIIELLKIMVLEFLNSHKYQPRMARPIHIQQSRKLGRAKNLVEGGSRAVQGNDLSQQSFDKVQIRKFRSPLDTWSRVKIGIPKVMSQIPEQSCKSNGQVCNGGRESNVLSAFTSISTDLSLLSSDLDTASFKRNTSIIAKSGRIICPPFGSPLLVTSETTSTPQPVQRDVSLSVANNINGEEECLHWINPVTKRVSILSSRTGLVNHSSKFKRLTPRISSHLAPEIKGHFPIRDLGVLPRDTKSPTKSSTWIDDIMRNWNNPIYRPTEMTIPQVPRDGLWNESPPLKHDHLHNCSQLNAVLVSQVTSTIIDSRISREALRQADIISQVDHKFILIKIHACSAPFDDQNASARVDMLVIVDQHAADERCRVEELLKELCNGPVMSESKTGDLSPRSGVPSTFLEKPIIVVMPEREAQLLQMHAQHFADWAITYEIQHAKSEMEQHQEYKIIVRSLPASIIERCTTMPKLLVELLRSELWSCSEMKRTSDIGRLETGSTSTDFKYPWLRTIHQCPQALLEMLNSRACRSAIMFNDVLSDGQCKGLISRLADCALPFQCAHGRPSMIPLVSLDSFTSNAMSDEKVDYHEVSFGAAFKKWKYGMHGGTEP